MTYHNIYTLSDSSATLVNPPNTHSGTDITIQNINDHGYIYVGNADVTVSSYGYRIAPGHAISFELPGRDSIYLVSSQTDMKAAVIRIGLEVQG